MGTLRNSVCMQATSAAVAADPSCSGSIGIRKDHPAHAVRDTHTLCGLTVHVYNWYPIENPTTTQMRRCVSIPLGYATAETSCT
jgi:hypothetical protein